MKILKNKTYNDLILRLKKSESDLKKQIEKTNEIQLEFNNLQSIYRIDKNMSDKNIQSLNERLNKSEIDRAKLKEGFQRAITHNSKLMSEKLELESKLSRKGTGKKGSKKEKQ